MFFICLNPFIMLFLQQGSERGAHDRASIKKANETPGPGYYNQRSSFDLLDNTQNVAHDTDFVLRLNETRKVQSGVFQSKTLRDSFMKDAYSRIDEPGPGYVMHCVNCAVCAGFV